MSLFDLIRHPITDIYNRHQLNHVPEFIINTWVELCAKDAQVDLNDYTYLLRWSSKVEIVRICVNQKVFAHNIRSMHTSDILTLTDVKEQYTKMLRELVHENEYYGD